MRAATIIRVPAAQPPVVPGAPGPAPAGPGQVTVTGDRRADHPAGPALRLAAPPTSARRRCRTCPACRASGTLRRRHAGLVPDRRRDAPRRRQHGRARRGPGRRPRWPLPDGADHRLIAALGLSAVAAWPALTWRGGLRPGEQVLVLGAGGVVGQAAVQLARLAAPAG